MGKAANKERASQVKSCGSVPRIALLYPYKNQNLSREEGVWTRLAISPVLTLVGQFLLHISPLAFLTIMSMI